ncbi:MAG: Gx transporter family protein [Tindallia sp. MSAO_Bac2]|nr:MAG: Gx transporter family protein [Tindallia sp. MSAO_Bac2]
MKTKKIVYYGILTSLGIALHIVEGMIPNPFVGMVPGAKIGLANIIALITLTIFGFRFALSVNLMRVVIAGLLTGAVTSMLYGLAGAFFSTLFMWVTIRYFGNFFSLVGVSVLGALAHNVAQLTVASMIIQNPRIFVYLPVMMFASIFTGIFIGMTAYFVLKKVTVYFRETSYSMT